MYKLPSTLALLVSIGACATPQIEPRTQFAPGGAVSRDAGGNAAIGGASRGDGVPPTVAAAPIEAVEIDEHDYETICEDIRRPGSRIVVERRCYTEDESAVNDELRQEVVREQFDQLRRDQEMLEQMERQREMQRQQDIMRRAMEHAPQAF